MSARAMAPAPGTQSPAQMEAQEAAEQAHIAAGAVATSASTALALGRHLADVENAYDLYDRASGAAMKSGSKDTFDDETDMLFRRMDAVRDLIATTPATSIGDAAVLVAEAVLVADDLESNGMTKEEVFARAGKMARMLTSALPWIAEAAGLNVGEMGWTHSVYLGVARYAGVSAREANAL